ncbi:collagenase [Streptomyces sp. LX-29]|uniref:collagenase n=1 Tax=Streptomyces sp. LX-29 TaxID=2900152 RepID=UPI00240DAD7A|nr:collagenase [Streptomyces sp. LX-29]WFB10880.1 collagenase [Streptomyces sp. LX-29]
MSHLPHIGTTPRRSTRARTRAAGRGGVRGTLGTGLLAAALSLGCALPLAPAAQAAPTTPAAFAPTASAPAAAGDAHAPVAGGAPAAGRAAPTGDPHPYDHAEHRATAPAVTTAAPVPRGGQRTPDGISRGRTPGDMSTAKAPRSTARPGGAPCTLDGITGLSPQGLADFLTDPAVTADGCLRGLIWTWDARLTPVMSDAHIQAVAGRAATLSPGHDGTGRSHLPELFTYLHAAAYHDFSRDEIDHTDAPTVDAVRGAVAAFGSAARTFEATRANAVTLREALYAASAPGLRHHQLPLIKRTLDTMAPGAATATNPDWAGAVLAALSVNYLGVYPGNKDTAFHSAAAADAGYRAAFQRFGGYSHLKGTVNAWVPRDAMSEYGRFGQIDGLKGGVVTDLGALLTTTKNSFGEFSAPWASVASWLNFFEACAPYGVCKKDIENRLFPNTFTYDKGAIKVRTGLSKATVDQLYYASKQVKAQFHRVLGTSQPLAGDPNTSLNIHLYASRADYEVFHPLLTGMGTANGGVYIERGATFYTYQRRVPQDSTLTLEELFRHEYTHYLNGRFAVPGFFGDGHWYEGDRTTAMDEGTAEFFDGATRDDGIAVRKSLVRSIIQDTAGGGPRMSVAQLLHATYDGDGFRFYSYAGTFFEFLWRERPAELRTMYSLLRADNPAGFDAWRNRLGADRGLQQAYDAFLDEQIAHVDDLFVPNTTFVPVGSLKYHRADDVRMQLQTATGAYPKCGDNGEAAGKRRFTCTGRITANLRDAADPGQVFKDMSETVDYFILDRSRPAANNFTDMNCSFGAVEIWSNGRAGSADYSCEGPLRG